MQLSFECPNCGFPKLEEVRFKDAELLISCARCGCQFTSKLSVNIDTQRIYSSDSTVDTIEYFYVLNMKFALKDPIHIEITNNVFNDKVYYNCEFEHGMLAVKVSSTNQYCCINAVLDHLEYETLRVLCMSEDCYEFDQEFKNKFLSAFIITRVDKRVNFAVENIDGTTIYMITQRRDLAMNYRRLLEQEGITTYVREIPFVVARY